MSGKLNTDVVFPMRGSGNYCIIMAGGMSNRLWPASREWKPKQFLKMDSTGKSFLRQAYDRCRGLVPEENIIVITIDRFGDLVRTQIPELDESNLLLEPYGRKTGPCVAYSIYSILKRDPSATVAMIPSDLRIDNDQEFRDTLSKAMEYASGHDVLMTLGLKPLRPDTNYGYIQAFGGKDAVKKDVPVKVKTFTEKPDRSIAEVFCNSGEFYWNSGIFVWQAGVIRAEMEKYIPEVTRLFSGWEMALGSPAEKDFLVKAYSDCSKISIDCGVMEKTDKAWLFLAEFGWSDFDNWWSLYDNARSYDEDGNVTGINKILLENTSGNVILASKKEKLLAVKGLDNFIVIDTDDVLIICPRNDEQYKSFIAKAALPGFEKYR